MKCTKCGLSPIEVGLMKKKIRQLNGKVVAYEKRWKAMKTRLYDKLIKELLTLKKRDE